MTCAVYAFRYLLQYRVHQVEYNHCNLKLHCLVSLQWHVPGVIRRRFSQRMIDQLSAICVEREIYLGRVKRLSKPTLDHVLSAEWFPYRETYRANGLTSLAQNSS